MKNAALISSFLITALTVFPSLTPAAEQDLFIASADKSAPGVYHATLNLETGAISQPKLVIEKVRTGFLDLHPQLPLLYVAGTDKAKGYVAAYSLAKNVSVTAEPLAKVGSKDGGTTHIEVGGGLVSVCHYGGKGTSVMRINDQGLPVKPVGTYAHSGSSVNPRRQTAPHPHGVAIHRGGKYICVADLGTDEVLVLKVDDAGKLSKVSAWKAKPGAGPRHVTFHPNYRWLYCINELDSTLAVLEFDASAGKLTERQVLSTLPSDFEGSSFTAEVVVHPNGKFVYGSNRGHDSTAVFAVDEDSGKLTFVEHEATGGGHPRFVGLDPTGKIYVAANRDSDNLVTFFIDPSTGALKPTGESAKVGRPMCVVFRPR